MNWTRFISAFAIEGACAAGDAIVAEISTAGAEAC